MGRRAILIDRDGTLCEPWSGREAETAGLRLLPRAAEALARANASGFQTVLITNQPEVGRGLLSVDRLAELHDDLRAALAAAGARLDGIYHCPHEPASREDPAAGCLCRKPRPGMLRRARDEMGIELADSFVIGDRLTDVEAAAAVGATGLLVLTGEGRAERGRLGTDFPGTAFVADDLLDAVDWILDRQLPAGPRNGALRDRVDQ